MNILDIIFPRRCVSCGRLGRYFCKNCVVKIKLFGHPICPVCEKAAIGGATHPKCKTRYSLDGLTSVFYYDGAVRKAIKLLKYRFVTDLAKEFIELIPSSFLSTANHQQPTILVPIPLHTSRLKFRGFNQAEVLGRLIADKLNIPIRPDILKRIKKTVPQVDMKDRKKRLANMENVFSVHQSPTANNKLPTIFLFDDVFTTGATLRAAANILKRNGATKIWGLTLAHG